MEYSKRVLVTGANRGIGLATVSAILRERADTQVLLGSRSLEKGQQSAALVVEKHAGWKERIVPIEIDTSSDASVQNAAAHVGEIFSADPAPLYALVNNAGIGFGSSALKQVLDVNTLGPRRVFEAFRPLLDPNGRVVNVSSAAGPNFVATCSKQRQQALTNPEVTWDQVESIMNEALRIQSEGGSFEASGMGSGDPYGLSKACLNAYTIALARQYPSMTINACTPGFIDTDLTRPFADAQGKSPADMGMKSVDEGTKVQLHLLFGTLAGSGWFFGSDAERSPLDRYRSPGDPPYAP